MGAPRYPDYEEGWFRVSQSAMSSFDLCEVKVMKDRESPRRDINIYSAVGSIAAEAMRYIYSGEIDRSDATGIDKICTKILEEEVEEAGGKENLPEDMDLDFALDFGRGAAKAAAFYLEGTPTTFERPMVIRLHEEKIELVGTPDRQDDHCIRDLKVSCTGKKKWNDRKAHQTMQTTFYHLQDYLWMIAEGKLKTEDDFDRWWKPDGAPGRGADIDHIWWLKGRRKQTKLNFNQGWNYQRFSSWRNESHAINVLRRIRTYKAAVESGILKPAKYDEWICAPKWCRHYETCEWVVGCREELIKEAYGVTGEDNGNDV